MVEGCYRFLRNGRSLATEEVGTSPHAIQGVNCSRIRQQLARMKYWPKNTSLPAIFLSALALGTLWMCFLLATHRHSVILKTLGEARRSLSQVSQPVGTQQKNAPAPHGPQHTVTLSWKPSTTAGVSYNVYRIGPSGMIKLNHSPITATTYVDTTVQPGQVYYYVAKAVNAKGIESGASNQVQVLVPSP
jgi:hypothetical protein